MLKLLRFVLFPYVLGIPPSPSVSLTQCSYNNNTSNIAISIQWTPTEYANDYSLIKAYELQKRTSNSYWETVRNDITGNQNYKANNYSMIQIIETHADNGEIMTDGYFILGLVFNGDYTYGGKDHRRTEIINYNATETDMKQAIESISPLVGTVSVQRNDGKIIGTYRWIIVFDTPKISSAPTLVVLDASCSTQWTGRSDQVSIKTLRNQKSGQSTCISDCTYVITELLPSTDYSFRLRSQNLQGVWNEWSKGSKEIRTCSFFSPVWAPPKIYFVSSSKHTIVFRWQSSEAHGPNIYYDVQQQCDNSSIWEFVTMNLSQTPIWTSAASTMLSPSTQCRFRVRAKTSIDIGEFSIPSDLLMTLDDSPSAPFNVTFDFSQTTSTSLLATWNEAKTENSSLIWYELQYRQFNGTYNKGKVISNSTLVNVTGLLPFTKYLYRVRAVTNIGKSYWVISPVQRTLYASEEFFLSLKFPALYYGHSNKEIVNGLSTYSIGWTSVGIKWDLPPISSFQGRCSPYAIELAKGYNNSEYSVVGNAPCLDTNYSIGNLIPDTDYNVRLRGISDVKTYNLGVSFRTLPLPKNHWKKVVFHNSQLQTRRQGLEYTALPYARDTPSARRGHTMSFYRNLMFLFGGDIYDYKDKAHRSYWPLISSSELWLYNISNSGWSRIDIGNGPIARSFHTMSAVNDSLLLFGGRSINTTNTTFFNDLWELNMPDQMVLGLTSNLLNISIPSRKRLYLTGQMNNSRDACIHEISVSIKFNHTCAQKLRARLYGPGPYSSVSRQLDGLVAGLNEDSLSTESTYISSGDPTLRSYVVNLLPSYDLFNTSCTNGTYDLLFTDTAETYYFGANFSGDIKPYEPLSVYRKMPAGGSWTLELFDSSENGNAGFVVEWDVHVKAAQCRPSITWNNVTYSGIPPSSRYKHTAVSFGNSLFIYGGYDNSNSQLKDMYRFDYLPRKWTKLNNVPSQRWKKRMSSVLTPYQLIASLTDQTVTGNLLLWRRNITFLFHDYNLMNISSDSENPSSRQFGSIAYAMNSSEYGKGRMLLFGGENNFSLFDDMWELFLDEVENNDVNLKVDNKCDMFLSSQGMLLWQNTCGAPLAADCDIHLLLFKSWCNDAFQTVNHL